MRAMRSVFSDEKKLSIALTSTEGQPEGLRAVLPGSVQPDLKKTPRSWGARRSVGKFTLRSRVDLLGVPKPCNLAINAESGEAARFGGALLDETSLA